MKKPTLNALFFIATSIIATGATAQNIYKCGTSYSQNPCPGGAVVDTNDPRSSDQKRQTDQATVRDAKVANSMETSRLKKEKADMASNTSWESMGNPYPENTGAASTAATNSLQAPKKEPAPFKAQVPGDKKKKTAVKKKAKSKKSKST